MTVGFTIKLSRKFFFFFQVCLISGWHSGGDTAHQCGLSMCSRGFAHKGLMKLQSIMGGLTHLPLFVPRSNKQLHKMFLGCPPTTKCTFCTVIVKSLMRGTHLWRHLLPPVSFHRPPLWKFYSVSLSNDNQGDVLALAKNSNAIL